MTTAPEGAPAHVQQNVEGHHNNLAGRDLTVNNNNYNYNLAPGDRDKLRRLRDLREALRKRLDEDLQTLRGGGAMLRLGIEEMPKAVPPTAGRFIDPRDGARHAVDASASVLQLYEKAKQKLLVLGEPGAGKSTMLTELALALLTQAEQDDGKPVPVVLGLARWGQTEAQRDMVEWVVVEMAKDYGSRREWVSEWLNDSRLFLVLDGLDQVAKERRAACVGAINSFLKEGRPALCVSCRVLEYNELPKVELFGAVQLQLLTELQVTEHIKAAGPKLAGFGEALGRDSELREAARSPLMLWLLSQIYKDAPVEQVELSAQATAQERQAHAVRDYVSQLFRQRELEVHTRDEQQTRRRELEVQTRDEQQTRRWLHYLAREMKARSQTVLLVEELQPDWLPGWALRAAYALASRAVVGVVLLLPLIWMGPAGLLAVGVTGACVGVPDALRFASGPPVHVSEPPALRGVLRVAGYAVLSLTIGILFGRVLDKSSSSSTSDFTPGTLSYSGGLILGLFFGLRSAPGRTTRDIRTRERLRWSWKGMAKGAGFSFLVCVLLPTVGGLLLAEKVDGDLVMTLVMWAMDFTILGALIGGFKSRAVETKLELSEVNEGIVLSLKNARRVLVIGAIAFGCGLAGVLSQRPIEGSLSERLIAITILSVWFGATIAWFPAMWFGGADVIQHFVLRLMLAASGVAPWRLSRFLVRGLSLGFLKRVGGGYSFVHRPLLEHFANEHFAESSDDGAGRPPPDT